MKKYWAYSAGGGLVIGLFVLLVANAAEEPQVVETRQPQPAVAYTKFVKIPVVIMPKGGECEEK